MKNNSIKENLYNYTKEVSEKILNTDFDILAKIVEKLLATHRNGKTVFTAGNGGSAATASHMANDFTKGCRVLGREGFKINCLADSTAIITCLANDFSYDDIFNIPLRTQGEKGDTLVVFSGSGNSPNIVKAVLTAKSMGIFTIGFSGRDGGKLNGLCDLLLIAPTDSMEQLEDMHMLYEHSMSCAVQEALEGEWGIEVLEYPDPKTPFKSAIFDFDGTVSLIREGWQDIMIPYFTEVLENTCKERGHMESKADILVCVRDFVDTLTGKQTIFQCIKLAEEVRKRGGEAGEPIEYKQEYLRRLNERIKHRHEDLEKGCNREKFMLPGTLNILNRFKEQGIKAYLASGTDEADVLKEVELLGLKSLFPGGIFGAKDEVTECTKNVVIQRIIKENEIQPCELVSFGDGYVEIELVKNIGGYTVGTATDEVRRKGINEWKRKRLLEAGAHAIIPNFDEVDKIMTFLNF